MNLKRIGASMILLLFCSILQAKEGYRISLRLYDSTDAPIKSLYSLPDSSGKTATLSLLGWDKDSAIGTSAVSRRGEFLFSGKKPLTPGEYLIKWNGKQIELFVSEPSEKSNEKIILRENELIQKKGSAENGHFLRFQNLINYGWKTLSSAAELKHKIDSTAERLNAEGLSNSLFALMLKAYSGTDYINDYIADSRILNTKYGKKAIIGYFTDIEYNSTDTVIKYIDNILSGENKETASAIGIEAFRYFADPKVMGQETVACHIAEKYFKSGVLPASENVKFEMNTYLMLNGSSLLGMPAQELEMRDTSGVMQSLHSLIKEGRYTIIYFYTDDCITCKIETPKLVEFVNSYKGAPINVFAVYTQDYKERWLNYINENLQISNPSVKWVNVWDPEIESGFHMLYNVISTPQIYVVDFTGNIIGRGLNVSSLEELVARMDEILNMLTID